MDITAEIKELIAQSTKLGLITTSYLNINIIYILDIKPGQYMFTDTFSLEDTLPAIDVS